MSKDELIKQISNTLNTDTPPAPLTKLFDNAVYSVKGMTEDIASKI